MNLDIVINFFKLIDKIPSTVKTAIIVILCSIGIINYSKTLSEDILRLYSIFKKIEEQKAEEYTLETASEVNRCIEDIAEKDTAAYNVILLNYHNTQLSLLGYSYLYLNCLTEKPKGINSEPVREYWDNLQYTYYEDELRKIHNSEFLRISDIEDIKGTMPKMYKRLKISGARSAAFYTIEGVKSPIGMVVILYNNPKTYTVGYYPLVVASNILKLAVILDYQNLNKAVND